jgi:hypothetical protein
MKQQLKALAPLMRSNKRFNKQQNKNKFSGFSALNLVLLILGIAIIASIAWWISTLERTWIAIENPSTAFNKNPMIAATRLLEKHRYQVQLAPVLTENLIKNMSNGTLIIANNDGYMSKEQSQALFTWIAQGNTLITFPKLSFVAAAKTTKAPHEANSNADSTGDKPSDENAEDEDVDEADAEAAKQEPAPIKSPEGNSEPDHPTTPTSEPKTKRVATPLIRDPIGEYLGVSTFYDERTGIKYFHSTLLKLPGASYPLKIRKPHVKLHKTSDQHQALFADEHADVLQVYAYGKGHIAVLADNIFELQGLQYYDHAELLLALTKLNQTKLNQKNSSVTIVQRLKIPSWHELLWNAFPLALCLLAVLVLLLLWRSVTRFGPLLPETNWERRSLMEHIETSGRWGWSTPVGRDLLLSAVRLSTKQVLQKRAPELQKLAVKEQLLRLAQVCKIDHEHLAHAWQDAASNHPHLFTRQIQLLQKVRAHYEHKS